MPGGFATIDSMNKKDEDLDENEDRREGGELGGHVCVRVCIPLSSC